MGERFRKFKETLRKFAKQGVSPFEIALGVSLGAFIAFIPMIGVHTALAFILALLLRLNPVIVFLGTQISNPFSFPVLVYISAQAGHLILNGAFLKIQWSSHIDWKNTYLIPTLLGSLTLGIIVSGISFISVYNLVKRRVR